MSDEQPKQSTNDKRAPGDATVLLNRLHEGDPDAADQLFLLVYEHLRATAEGYFKSERVEHTLQPTALVHEAYIKLINQEEKSWANRDHFYAVAARAMRQILIDHARAHNALKRGGDRQREGLTNIETPEAGSVIDAIALEECLKMLDEIDPEGAQIVQLRFFGGLSHSEIAQVMNMSVKTVERRWRRCRAFIKPRLGGDDS
ncbi:MAG: ECF-type sigma factor [Planctomycetota bacterium]